jgi:hypothetical protein
VSQVGRVRLVGNPTCLPRPTCLTHPQVRLKNKGVKPISEPRNVGAIRFGFLEDPNGVRVELISRGE